MRRVVGEWDPGDVVKPPCGHSPNPRIGIPVDEFDCSRELAHIFLFEHDKRMVKNFGEANYVRWMDDQNIGACSCTEARKIVNHLTRSLAAQRLTLNSGKASFLTPDQVVVHFQLDANRLLNEWEKKYSNKLPKQITEARRGLEVVCKRILSGTSAGRGYWDKILKRMYGYTARVGSDILDDRMYNDLIEYPHLDERIFLSLAVRNKGDELVSLFWQYLENGESLFEATEASFFEACLLLDAGEDMERGIKELAHSFAKGKLEKQSAGIFGKASAILCLYWFGTSIAELVELFAVEEGPYLPCSVARSWLACVSARHPQSLARIQKKLVGHPSDDVARLSRSLSDLLSGRIDRVGNYKRQKGRWPKYGKFYDTRAWLQLELISRSPAVQLRSISKSDLKSFANLTRTRQEKRVLSRISRRLT